ncbi:MAG: hypothetical protein NE327_10360 [Lentisphaeraceae bacterium]|nr:hypothetical protein [Lentisphaeraceae bacterium]
MCNAKPVVLVFLMSLFLTVQSAEKDLFHLELEQLTFGEKHHFFGYIGQSKTIPWNKSGRYILGMEVDQISKMPKAEQAATIILIDTQNNNDIIILDKTHGWNPQQGTMFYWNPLKPETQFFFNDRNLESGKVFTVLFDIELKKRIKEYRFEETPIGNSGVAIDGSAFLGLNYGRLARLRSVTGYREALDWSKDDKAPENDGVFKVDVRTGEKTLLVSYKEMEEKLKEAHPELKNRGLFINHTLWNRNSDRIYFFVRSAFTKKDRINVPFTVHADGTNLQIHRLYGGHPEWAEGNVIIGKNKKDQILYDVDKKEKIGKWGDPKIFPIPEGDISLSPNSQWFVNGFKDGDKNVYSVFHVKSGSYLHSEGLSRGKFSGKVRIDPAPRWNRTNDTILVPGVAENNTRQLFLLKIIKNRY